MNNELRIGDTKNGFSMCSHEYLMTRADLNANRINIRHRNSRLYNETLNYRYLNPQANYSYAKYCTSHRGAKQQSMSM